MRLFGAVVSAAALSACAVDFPVIGETGIAGSAPVIVTEGFAGEAGEWASGSGSMTLVGWGGTVCTAEYLHGAPRDGTGSMTCTDGRSGFIQFASGRGSGRIGATALKFAFGN